MTNAAFVERLLIILRPDPSRVVIRPYVPGADGDHARAKRIAGRVMKLGDAAITVELNDLMRDFAGHHAEVEAVFAQRYAEVQGVIGNDAPVVGDRALLIGAYVRAWALSSSAARPRVPHGAATDRWGSVW